MNVPDELRYSKEHEWVAGADRAATIGITDYAQEELGDIVFVELPAIGSVLTRDATLGVVESVKAVSDVYAPVSATVIEVNGRLTANPEVINEDPYGQGWMVRVTLTDPAELDQLMTAAQYRDFVAHEKE
jgi:glycine cleavage system H protein